MNRRGFLGLGAAASAAAFLPSPAQAEMVVDIETYGAYSAEALAYFAVALRDGFISRSYVLKHIFHIDKVEQEWLKSTLA
jgi:hypothetical protein